MATVPHRTIVTALLLLRATAALSELPPARRLPPAFSPPPPPTVRRRVPTASPSALAAGTLDPLPAYGGTPAAECYWRPASSYLPRVSLASLRVGDRLRSVRLDKKYDLLSGRTGPKIFFDCGVCRTDADGRAQIVHGMMRLGGRDGGISRAKKIARLFMPGRELDLYVTAARVAEGALEVSSSAPPAAAAKKRRRASGVAVGEELVGTVARVRDYGVFFDVGANRHGLLHIQSVADTMGKYVDKAEGLKRDCGLTVGTQIKLCVKANNGRKGLSLDFTDETKAVAEAERNPPEEQEVPEDDMDGEETSALAASAPEDDDSVASDGEETYDADDEDYDDQEEDEDGRLEELMGLDSW